MISGLTTDHAPFQYFWCSGVSSVGVPGVFHGCFTSSGFERHPFFSAGNNRVEFVWLARCNAVFDANLNSWVLSGLFGTRACCHASQCNNMVIKINSNGEINFTISYNLHVFLVPNKPPGTHEFKFALKTAFLRCL